MSDHQCCNPPVELAPSRRADVFAGNPSLDTRRHDILQLIPKP